MLAPLRVIDDPAPGQRVECPVASCVELRFAAGLTTSWQVAERPGHLAPIGEGHDESGSHLTFVVFAEATDARPLRLVRTHPGRGHVEEREIHVVTELATSTPTASPGLWGVREPVG